MDVGGSSVKSGLFSGETVEDIKTTPIDSKGNSENIITTFSILLIVIPLQTKLVVLPFPCQ